MSTPKANCHHWWALDVALFLEVWAKKGKLQIHSFDIKWEQTLKSHVNN